MVTHTHIYIGLYTFPLSSPRSFKVEQLENIFQGWTKGGSLKWISGAPVAGRGVKKPTTFVKMIV